jgi:hypothetical protein
VDGEGLHLGIVKRDSNWYCSEVVLDRSLGYGVYAYQLASRVDSLDYQAVASGFLYESLTRELDIEFSPVLANPHNAQYVVQPFSHPGNLVRFEMPPVGQSTHRIVWSSDSVRCDSWRGHGNEPQEDSLIFSWTYTGSDIPPPGGERMRFNLWLFEGHPPTSGFSDYLIVQRFSFRAHT